MKLIDVLNHTNTIEKTAFYKILNNLIENHDTNQIEEILNESVRHLKDIENESIAKVFVLLRDEYKKCIKTQLGENLSQLDIFIDILIRDGNAILQDDWFENLYRKELDHLSKASKEFNKLIEGDSKDLDDQRRRDYQIYKSCVLTAYSNDETNNLDKKVTSDEYSMLRTLAQELELSNEEVRLINFNIVPLEAIKIDAIIKDLKDIGIVFYHKKERQVFTPDEIIKLLRELRGKSVADKYLRRVLKTLSGPQLNLICKRHSINQRSGLEDKIKTIINQGISFKSILAHGIHKDGLTMNDKKKHLNSLMEELNIPPKGVTIDDKISLMVDHFNKMEKDEVIGISQEGYSALCRDLNDSLPKLNKFLKNEFEFKEDNVLDSEFLSNHNIKPRDILDLLTNDELKSFCEARNISKRGDEVQNILDSYTDSESIYIENYINIGNRDLNTLKANNINLSAADLGLKYEDVTKLLFQGLGFNVDESLKDELSTNKDKMDIILNVGNKEVIIVECKTDKSSKYNKFSACSRQIKSYQKQAERSNYRVVKTLLVAPDFTPDFVQECDLDLDVNLSLISSDVLFNIWNGFKKASHQVFPVNLLMRDALISDDKILKALKVK